MKINRLLAAALTAGMFFTSCDSESKNGGTQDPTQDRVVQISVARENTRGIGGAVTDNSEVIFSSGYLLFTNAVDAVTMVVAIEDTDDAYSEADLTVGLGALETAPGAEILGVPGSSSMVYFIANVPAAVGPVAVGDTVGDYLADVESQYSSDGSVTNVSLYGGGALTPSLAPGAAIDQYVASFTARPIVGRFEINAVTGMPSAASSALTYQIDGIFIDNFYSQMTLNGNALAADIEYNSANIAQYAPDAANGSYTTARAGVVYDYNATEGLADEAAVAPGVDMVWNYNLLAPTASDASIAMPAIVIKVSNVVVDGLAWPGEYFLTVSNFYSDPGTNEVSINQLAQGNIYVIPNLTFDETDLTTTPYVKNKRVMVEVALMNWESQEVGWDL